jgi:NADH dehydrogenase/NADH:ubiquinone oxidoreductase subunit G
MADPIQPALGANLNPDSTPETGVKEGPPVDEADKEARKSRWLEVLTSPEMLAAIGQFGVNIAQPRSILQSRGGKLANDFAGAAGASGRVATNRAETIAAEASTAAETAKAAAATTSAETAKTQVEKVQIPQVVGKIAETAAGTALEETQAASLKATTKREEGLQELRKKHLEAQTGALSVSTDRDKANIDNDLKNSQASYINALANKSNAVVKARGAEAVNALNTANAEAAEALKTLREAQAEAAASGSPLTGTAQQTQLLANAIKKQAAAHGTPMTDSEATLSAAGFLKTGTTLSRETFIANFIEDRNKAFVDKEPTDEHLAAWGKMAATAADALGLQSISPTTSATPSNVTRTGTLITKDNISTLMQGSTLDTGTIQGVDSLGNPTLGQQIIRADGTKAEINGTPIVIGE